jgi:uncharacterized protein YggT (Ycf19 family)
MNIGMWDSLYNIILLLFWNKIWSTDDFDMIRNPILAPIVRLQNQTVDFLHPVLPFMPTKIIMATAMLFLIIFRGAIIPAGAEWKLLFGLAIGITRDGGILINILFSFLSFAIFTFKIWAISLIYIKTKQQSAVNDNTEALFHISKPFSLLEITIRPLVILLFGMLIAYGLLSLSNGRPHTASSLLITITQLAVLSLSGLVDILTIIRQLVFAMIIGSLLSSLMAAQSINGFCNEGINTLLGPLRRYPIRIGMFDLTPIVFIFILQLAWQFLQGILLNALQNMS